MVHLLVVELVYANIAILGWAVLVVLGRVGVSGTLNQQVTRSK